MAPVLQVLDMGSSAAQSYDADLPVFILGHSMGGLIAVHAADQAHNAQSLNLHAVVTCHTTPTARQPAFPPHLHACNVPPHHRPLSLLCQVLSAPALAPDPTEATPLLIAAGRVISKVRHAMLMGACDMPC